MMDVALVNDGPVGVDYCCEDGVVGSRSCSQQGIWTRTDLCKVTIEIDTDPPKMDNPTTLGELPTEGDTYKGKIQQQFTLPASLLE